MRSALIARKGTQSYQKREASRYQKPTTVDWFENKTVVAQNSHEAEAECVQNSADNEIFRGLALMIGFRPDVDDSLLWIVRDALKDIPEPWVMSVQDNKLQFFDTSRQLTSDQHPRLHFYQDLLAEHIKYRDSLLNTVAARKKSDPFPMKRLTKNSEQSVRLMNTLQSRLKDLHTQHNSDVSRASDVGSHEDSIVVQLQQRTLARMRSLHNHETELSSDEEEALANSQFAKNIRQFHQNTEKLAGRQSL